MTTNNQPQYLNPVYNPNQWNFSSEVYSGPYTNTNYKLLINLNTSAITNGDSFTVDGYEFLFSNTPTQNQLPVPTLVVYQYLINFVKDAFMNIPAFNTYEYIVDYTNPVQLKLTLIDKVAFSNKVLTYSGDSGFTFTQTLPITVTASIVASFSSNDAFVFEGGVGAGFGTTGDVSIGGELVSRYTNIV